LLNADDIIAQLLKIKNDILCTYVNREVTNWFDGFIRLRVEREMVEVLLREVEQNGLVVGHAVGNDANPNSMIRSEK
jgi:hypothetical protein